MILEIVGQGESICMAKYQSYVMRSANDFEVPGKCFEIVCILMATLVDYNRLLCRIIFCSNVEEQSIDMLQKNQVRIAAGFKLVVMARLNLL